MPRHETTQRPMLYTQPLTDEDVLLVFANADEELSRKEIAERVWRKVTPDFRNRIERLVGQGKLSKDIQDLPNGRQMFWYKRVQT